VFKLGPWANVLAEHNKPTQKTKICLLAEFFMVSSKTPNGLICKQIWIFDLFGGFAKLNPYWPRNPVLTGIVDLPLVFHCTAWMAGNPRLI
jgi:hypothetical protein